MAQRSHEMRSGHLPQLIRHLGFFGSVLIGDEFNFRQFMMRECFFQCLYDVFGGTFLPNQDHRFKAMAQRA